LHSLHRFSAPVEGRDHQWRSSTEKAGTVRIPTNQAHLASARVDQEIGPYVVGFKSRRNVLEMRFIGHLLTSHGHDLGPSIFAEASSALENLENFKRIYMCFVPSLTRLFPFCRASANRALFWSRKAAVREASFLAFRSKNGTNGNSKEIYQPRVC
jgi:hypothetical protein